MSDGHVAREAYEDAGPWVGSAARPRHACANHEECGNLARPHRTHCHACSKRRQRRSRRRQPRYRSPWERLVAAAARFAGAESAEEYTQAEAVLRSAALHYARCHPNGRGQAPKAPAQLGLFETCPPSR